MADSSDTPSLTDLAADLAGETDVKEEPVVEEPTEPESSPDETTEPKEEAEAPETEAEPEPSEEEAGEADETETEQPTKGEVRKQTLNTEIRDLVAERNRLRSEVETENAKYYAPQSPEEIMAETGQSAADARITAMEQRQELSDFNNRVAEAQLVIGSESERVLNDFPIFNPDSPDYRPEVAQAAAKVTNKALEFDQNTGQVIGSKISIYELYQTIASANQAAAVENQIKGQRAAKQQLAAAEPQSSAVPKQPKDDDFLKGLLGDKYNKD